MADWYVSKSGKTHGPFSSQQLVQLAAEQKIGPQTEVRMGEGGKWAPAEDVKGLFVPAQAAVGTAPHWSRDNDRPRQLQLLMRTAQRRKKNCLRSTRQCFATSRSSL